MKILNNNSVQIFSYADFLKFEDKMQVIKETSFFDSLNEDGFFVVVEGDFSLDENVSIDELLDELREEAKIDDSQFIQLVWFAGDVHIAKTIFEEETSNYSAALFFEKEFKAKNFIQGGTSLYFLKSIKVDQIFYTKLNAEGNISTKGAEKNIKIDVCNNKIWKIGAEQYDLGDYDISPETLDNIFIKKDKFFYCEEDGCFPLEEDDVLVQAIIDNKKIFKA